MYLLKQPRQYFTKHNTILFVLPDCLVAIFSLAVYYNAILPVQNLIFSTIVTFIITHLFTLYQVDKSAKINLSNAELKALCSQMNPHFIFNSLNSINNYITKNEPKLATEYLNKFAKLIRMILENSEKKSIPLGENLKVLELYMQLESKRLDDKFKYNIHVAKNVDMENTLIPPMILQPFIENSIWHGIAQKEGKGNILIDISINGQILHCIIDDDGIGFEKSSRFISKEKQSLGMKITKARIDIM